MTDREALLDIVKACEVVPFTHRPGHAVEKVLGIARAALAADVAPEPVPHDTPAAASVTGDDLGAYWDRRDVLRADVAPEPREALWNDPAPRTAAGRDLWDRLVNEGYSAVGGAIAFSQSQGRDIGQRICQIEAEADVAPDDEGLEHRVRLVQQALGAAGVLAPGMNSWSAARSVLDHLDALAYAGQPFASVARLQNPPYREPVGDREDGNG